MRRTTALAQILGSGHGINPFATTGRWPNRMHPRRDDEGHPDGNGGDSADEGAGDGSDADAGDAKPNADGDGDEQLGEGGKKALAAERARAKALEKKLAERDKADEKARLAKLDEKQRAEAERDAEKTRAEKLEQDLAVERAARRHGITDDKDLELLAGVPADKVDALAKRIAKPKGNDFGTEVGGSKSTSFDPVKVAQNAGTRKSGLTIY